MASGVSQTGVRGGVVGGFTIIGLPEVIAKLEGVGRVCRIYLGVIMRENAMLLESQARANIHSLTGNLASGTKAHKLGPYTWEVSSSSLDGDVSSKNTKEYAGFVENGTQYMEGQFYMQRAYDQVQVTLAASVKALAEAINRL